MLAYAVAPTPMAADAYEAAHEKFTQLIAQLRSSEARQMTHSDLEALLAIEGREVRRACCKPTWMSGALGRPDRKSTRLNSSHSRASRMPSSA